MFAAVGSEYESIVMSCVCVHRHEFNGLLYVSMFAAVGSEYESIAMSCVCVCVAMNSTGYFMFLCLQQLEVNMNRLPCHACVCALP